VIAKETHSAQQEQKRSLRRKGGDVRDSRDIQSLIAMSRCRKEPEQAFQVAMTREGRS
jgi:hypothetical protein